MSITKYKDFLLETSSSPIINSVIDVLRISDIPLSCSDIFSKMNQNTLRSTNKLNSLNSTLVRYSENSSDKKPSSNSYFRIVDTGPNKFWLIDRMSELPEEYLDEINPEDIEYSEDVKKMTFANAAQKILIDNNNEPMSTSEIWVKISEKDLVETKGKIPQGILLKTMSIHSDNSPVKDRKGTNIFTITQTSPIKFKLINPNTIQDIEPEDEEIIKFGPFSVIPTDVQDQDEKEIKSLKPAERNPFGCKQKNGEETSAICIVGDTSVGKSYRIKKTLINAKHKYIIFSPTSATTNLLLQYDRGDYTLSTLGEFIKRAVENPSSYYTAVLDESHKYIKMIDGELLQCLSSKRNDGDRFISFDNPIVKRLYNFLETNDDFGGVGLIPDNLGFILLSSKKDAILNSDLMGRISIINLDKSHRDIEFAIDKLEELIEPSEDDEYSNE
jgi:hypothetical protein